MGVVGFVRVAGIPRVPGAVVNTPAAVAGSSHKQKETAQMVIAEMEQRVDTFAVAENGLARDCQSGWQHYFRPGDNRFVGSNNYYSYDIDILTMGIQVCFNKKIDCFPCLLPGHDSVFFIERTRPAGSFKENICGRDKSDGRDKSGPYIAIWPTYLNGRILLY